MRELQVWSGGSKRRIGEALKAWPQRWEALLPRVQRLHRLGGERWEISGREGGVMMMMQ